ncbi:MAG: pyridoxal phosphate-dependent aminotransferase [Treponema sp.]|jgi:putative C-S lyase|nr:pyridoxal phosphate-dependent aminotransferase [Treponema sp.]
MEYDFTTRVDRRGSGAAKWEEMFRKNPNVSPEIIPLSVADMELPNPPEIIQGLKDHLDKTILGYTTVTPEYTQAVIAWMKKRHNWDVKAEWIIQSPGVVPAFFTALKAFTEPGDGVIIQPPVYYPFFMAIENNDRVLVSNPLIRDDAKLSYRIDFEDLEAKAKDPKNKLLIFCSPHNPVGRVWAREELQRISDICLANNVLVVSDEIHFDLLAPGVEHTVYATLSKEAEGHCVICTAPSKTFNLAGMQDSNIIIPNEELRKKLQAEFMKSALFMISNLGLKAGELAYTKCEAWLDAFLLVLKQNYEYVKDYIARHIPQIKVYPLEGTYLMWLDFRAFGLDQQALEQFMISEAEWFTDEGYLFGKEGSGFERINLACPLSVLEEAMDRLKKALAARKLI